MDDIKREENEEIKETEEIAATEEKGEEAAQTPAEEAHAGPDAKITEGGEEQEESEKPAKKRNKAGMIIAIVLAVLVVAAGATFAIIKFLVPKLTYDKGVELMENGKYMDAVKEFKKLENYKDENVLINTCYLKNQGEDFYKAITKAKFGDTIKFGHFEQDNDEENGEEPIEWRVVTTDKKDVLLLSKYCLLTMNFNDELEDTKWENCQIREYLNGEFYDKAFTKEEKLLIPEVTNEVEITPYNTSLDLKPTKDKVFLISIIDAESYFPTNNDRKATGTKWARANGLGANKDGTCWWWTRSSGGRLNLACVVYGAGTYTLWGTDVNNDRNGIRPALWIHVE